ncbi:helix-turn-helix domain-containing protein [Geomonas ferrireducens]|uniref:helix-turn-helix domain-containing protein n=1 Tax=Geomonas ferrireducens TaxID=2570227 RepID=UPI001FEC107D|nr:helix-turn-helix domain-containing protein [Geomonas ferrireducens]
MTVHGPKLRHLGLVRDEIGITRVEGVLSLGILSRLEKLTSREEPLFHLPGKLRQEVHLSRAGRLLLQPQDLPVIEVEMACGECVGGFTRVGEEAQKGEKQRVMGLVVVPISQALLQCLFTLARHFCIAFQELIQDRGEHVVRRDVVDPLERLDAGPVHRGVCGDGAGVARPVGGGIGDPLLAQTGIEDRAEGNGLGSEQLNSRL